MKIEFKGENKELFTEPENQNKTEEKKDEKPK
jgi:hypothetical protein